MSKENPPIITLLGLLEVLYLDPLFGDHRKTGARVKCYPLEEAEVRESFDDGRGHSGALFSETTPLNRDVFQEALTKGYIAGVLEPGYVSRTDFKLTEHGRQELFRLGRAIAEANKRGAQMEQNPDHANQPS